MSHQMIDHARSEMLPRLVREIQSIEKSVRKHRNILPATTQRRELDVKNLQAVQQVLAKTCLLDKRVQVGISVHDQPDIHRPSLRFPDPSLFPFLQHP